MRSDQADGFREALIDLTAVAQSDLRKIVRLAEEHPEESRKILEELYPQVLQGYAGTAEELGAAILATYAPDVPVLRSAPLPDGMVSASIGNALYANADTFATLGGSMQRMIFNGARDLITNSIDLADELTPGRVSTTVTYARHASATACGFCRMLATRGAVYTSRSSAGVVVGRGVEMDELDRMWRGDQKGSVHGLSGRFVAGGVKPRGSRELGSTYHDHCRCVVVPSSESEPYIPPAYVAEWMDDYEKAFDGANDEGITGRKKLNYIVRNMGGDNHEH